MFFSGSADTTVTKSKAKYKALFPFEARHPDELSILDGDIVIVCNLLICTNIKMC